MLTVKLEFSKKVRNSGADLRQVEQQLAPAIATALAEAIQGRVQGRGDLAGQRFPGWDALEVGEDGIKRGRSKSVSSRYPDHAIGEVGPSGAEFFESSAEYHQANGTRPGTYSTTGGMWSGLSVLVLTPTLVRILFRGRSEGQDARFVNRKSRPLKVSNALKVVTVLNQHGVNVLALAESELAGIERGTVQAIAGGVSVALPVSWEGAGPPSGALGSILSAAINGR